ncbi:MAG TPA: acyl-CoA dehydrogenase family protein [Ramlibacter sp.]|nr:acyl-CoA dehydrogenase family protein [Ramlibacter sp.]
MSFQTVPMFPGDLYDAASRFASQAAAAAPGPSSAQVRGQQWSKVLEMGWPAVLVPQAQGGAGGTLPDLAAIVEATARQSLNLPIIERCAVAPALLSALPQERARVLLEQVAAGEADLACAVQPDLLRGLDALAGPDGSWELEGTITLDMSLAASHTLVHVPAAQALLVLEAAQMPPPAMRYRSVDGRELADIALRRVRVPASQLLGSGAQVQPAVDKALDLGALMSAAEVVGALGALIEQTIAYLKTRTQFGVHLSTFQALRHRVVEMYVQYESASGLVARIVHDGVEKGQLASRDVSLAKAYLGKVGRFGAEAAIQLHGGMGMTEELLSARLAQRMLSCEFEYGDRFSHLTRLVDRGLAHSAQELHDEPVPA